MKILYQSIEQAAGRFVPVSYQIADRHDVPMRGLGKKPRNCKDRIASMLAVDERYESTIRIDGWRVL